MHLRFMRTPIFLVLVLLATGLNIEVSASTLSLNKEKSKLRFIISKDLPAGTYQLWNLTTNQKVGESIVKNSTEDEAFGEASIESGDFNSKFVILDPQNEVVTTLSGKNEKKNYDKSSDPLGIGSQVNAEKKSNAKSSDRGVLKQVMSQSLPVSLPQENDDQLNFYNKLIAGQKSQMAQIESKSRKNKMKIQKILKNKSVDCQKELSGKNKTSPEVETFCKSVDELSSAYKAAESQLKKTSDLKLSAMREMGSASSQTIASTEKILAKNFELPTNLDPKSLEVPATVKTNASVATQAPTGSWGKPQRFYDVKEFCICMCGSAMAQVPGKSCPPDSSEVNGSCYSNSFGPYYLNNAGTTCDLASSTPVMKFLQDTYTPSTLKGGLKIAHGKEALAQAEALIASGEINKLSGPEAAEMAYELGQINYQSFKEGEPINRAAAQFTEIWAKYKKEQDELQAKNQAEAIHKIMNPPKFGILEFKFLDGNLPENRAPIDTIAIIPVTGPVSLKDGKAVVKLVGGFWGQHGWEVGVDKKNFYPIDTPVELKDGDVVYLRGKTVKSYGHTLGIETVFTAAKVNGHDHGQRENLWVKTEDGCNADGMIQWEHQFNLAPHTFPKGENEKCFATGIHGELDKDGFWKFGTGISLLPPMGKFGTEVTIKCSELNHLAGKVTPYKLSPYKNPYNGQTQDYFPVRDCKVSGSIKYVCTPGQGWVPAKNGGVCELE